MIKANPIYEKRDYSYVLNELDDEIYRCISLTKGEILYRMGHYQESYQEIKDGYNWEDKQFKIIVKDKLGEPIAPDDYPDEIRDNIVTGIRWRLTRAFLYKKNNNLDQAEEEIQRIKENNSDWEIYREADKLSRKIGYEYDLIEYLSL
ncbi:MAG: hypothetical protein ACOC2J_01505 [bacterium]